MVVVVVISIMFHRSEHQTKEQKYIFICNYNTLRTIFNQQNRKQTKMALIE